MGWWKTVPFLLLRAKGEIRAEGPITCPKWSWYSTEGPNTWPKASILGRRQYLAEGLNTWPKASILGRRPHSLVEGLNTWPKAPAQAMLGTFRYSIKYLYKYLSQSTSQQHFIKTCIKILGSTNIIYISSLFLIFSCQRNVVKMHRASFRSIFILTV